MLDSLELYTRLTSLDANLSIVRFKPCHWVQSEAQCSLAAIASHAPNRMRSLVPYCPPHIRPTDAVTLRRLCSCVFELSLSASDLLLMARDSELALSPEWKTHSVRSFAVPTAAHPAPRTHNYFRNDFVVSTLPAALPSCTHLRIDSYEEPTRVSYFSQQSCRQGRTDSRLYPHAQAQSSYTDDQ